MVRTTLGAEVETTVTVSGSESVDFLTLDKTSTVSSRSVERTIVTAPAGSVYELVTVKLQASGISAATSGKHGWLVGSDSLSGGILSFNSNAGDDVEYDFSTVRSGTKIQLPSDPAAQSLVLRGLRFDSTDGLNLRYRNDTDADQPGRRNIELWVREIQVSE